MPLVSVLAAMEYNGVSLDTKLLKSMSGKLINPVGQLFYCFIKFAGHTF